MERGHSAPIAGFAHVAVGLVSGRLRAESSGWRLFFTLAGFALLALLPDFDVLPVALGVPDHTFWGHRGYSHTPLFALVVGGLAALLVRGRDPRPLRLGLVVALVVGSHGLVDGLTQEGRGIMYAWPLLADRFHLGWRPIPDAPRGLAFFSRVGLHHLGTELIYFFPFSLFALWPRRPRRPGARPRPATVGRRWNAGRPGPAPP